MEKRVKKVMVRRTFSEEFKRTTVKDYESGKHTALEISRLFNISESCIYSWIYKYSVYNKKKIRVVEMSESTTKKVKELQQKIKELEQIDYLEKMIDLAKEELGVTIKKNSNTRQSNISAKTGKR